MLRCIMDEKIYRIAKIDGEYAYLMSEDGEELFIAMALLPVGADEGSVLSYSFPDFKLI